MSLQLPFTLVHGMDDVQADLEVISGQALNANSNLSDLASRTTALKNLGITRGVATLTFTASPDSASLTITHGLEGTPTSVVATSLQAALFGQIPICNASNLGPTTFNLNGQTTNTWTGTVTVSWIAIL